MIILNLLCELVLTDESVHFAMFAYNVRAFSLLCITLDNLCVSMGHMSCSSPLTFELHITVYVKKLTH